MSILFLDLDETLVSTKQLGLSINLFKYPRELEIKPTAFDARVEISKKRRDYFNERTKLLEDLVPFAEKSGVRIIDDDEIFISKLRPGTVEFIENCRPYFDKICVLTAGGEAFQSKMLLSHGILHLFDAVYSTYGDWDAVPNDPVSFLVDNLSLGSLGITEKMTIMRHVTKDEFERVRRGDSSQFLRSYIERFFIQAPNFTGDSKDKGLKKVHKELMRKIKS